MVATGVAFDGDLDGRPGGVHNFWFQANPLERVLDITGVGTTFMGPGVQSVTIVDAQGMSQIFPFVLLAGPADAGNGNIDFNAGSTQEEIRDDLISEINNTFGGSVIDCGTLIPVSACPLGTTRIVLLGDLSVPMGSGAICPDV